MPSGDGFLRRMHHTIVSVSLSVPVHLVQVISDLTSTLKRVCDDLSRPGSGVSTRHLPHHRPAMSANTHRAYQSALNHLDDWLAGRDLADAALADYPVIMFRADRD